MFHRGSCGTQRSTVTDPRRGASAYEPACETLSFIDISQYSLQYLIDVGSDVNTLDNENATVIHLVAEEGCIKCARILLPLCTDIDAKMKNGDTPLIRAVKRGKEMSSRSKPKMNE